MDKDKGAFIGLGLFEGRDFSLSTAMLAPVILVLFFEAIAPSFPFFGREFMQNVALGIEDIGRFSK
jgi:hypothetical protein